MHMVVVTTRGKSVVKHIVHIVCYHIETKTTKNTSIYL